VRSLWWYASAPNALDGRLPVQWWRVFMPDGHVPAESQRTELRKGKPTMRSEPHQSDYDGTDTDSLYVRKMAELHEMARELDRLKERIEHTERQALERGLIKAHSQ
jgi:hypothetical protein